MVAQTRHRDKPRLRLKARQAVWNAMKVLWSLENVVPHLITGKSAFRLTLSYQCKALQDYKSQSVP